MKVKLHELWGNALLQEYFMDAWNVFDYSLVVFSCADLAAWLNQG